jgi:hypothetical protein
LKEIYGPRSLWFKPGDEYFQDGISPPVSHALSEFELQAADMMDLAEIGHRACLSLFNRPWWERAWVIQEVAFASDITVYFGEYSVPRYYFTRLVDHKSSKAWVASAGLRKHLRSFRRIREENSYLGPVDQTVFGFLESHYDDPSKETHSPLELLDLHRHCLSTDPRDKVNALLGMANDKLSLDIQIDYSTDRTCDQVFAKSLSLLSRRVSR